MADDHSIDLTNTCMLVSDSNEISKQMDSKQLGYGTLVEMAEDNLFGKHLNMSSYLTLNQYDTYGKMLQQRCEQLKQMKESLQDAESSIPKFRVVDGQVILIEADGVPEGTSPEQYARDKWDITSEYQLLPIPNCMLRGMLDVKEGSGQVNKLIPEKPQNVKVRLKNENIPPHMHHSSVTTGGNFPTAQGDNRQSYFTQGNTVYDMFYNDSMTIGLNRNELDGTIDRFNVDACGSNDTQDSANPEMSHDNMPKYHAFYGFVVQKIAKQG